MNRKTFFIVLLCSIMCGSLSAQSRPSGKRGAAIIKGDTKVNKLVEKHIELNEKVKTISGFRIQVASLSGANAKERAFELKEKLKAENPAVQSYVMYVEPNFRVRLGDFRTRLEAYAYLQTIKSTTNGTIVSDDIFPIQYDWESLIPETDEDAAE